VITCKVCSKEFCNNRGGQLTNHLREYHDLTLENYVITTEYGGVPPRCVCGLCEEKPVFSRGKFLIYALHHNKFKVKEKLYIEKNGDPKCQQCQGIVKKFDRGIPRKYCSTKCMGKNVGFSLESTQKIIKTNVQEKYGVSNVAKLNFIKQKISASNSGKSWEMSECGKQKISFSIKKKWQTDLEYRKKMENLFHSFDKEKQEEILEKLFLSSKNRLSKLHQKIRIELNLSELGFVSEQKVSKYFVDELNEEKKIIVEVHGDYPHANPKKYADDFVIRLHGQSYLAIEKREHDSLRKEKLEELGYHVFVIWESDNLEEKRKEIIARLQNEKTI
jgi:very-short-patch-repair endonuclease